MRLVLIVLLLALIGLQYKLWLGDGSVLQWLRLENKWVLEEQENTKLAARNSAVEADILELKSGDQALEGQARYELGMVKEGEVYYQFDDRPHR
jgi:cell division protein FtsB